MRDIEFDEFGAKVHVDGKTGERIIRLVESVPDLKLWLSMHPKKDDPNAYVWHSQKGGRLGNGGWKWQLKKYAERAGIKKNIFPHLLRHSRATHLAGAGFNQPQLCEIFGWSKNSKMPSIYIHLSGRDTDTAIKELYGINVEDADNQFDKSNKNAHSVITSTRQTPDFVRGATLRLTPARLKNHTQSIRNRLGRPPSFIRHSLS